MALRLEALLAKTEASVEHYLRALDDYTEAEFARARSAHEWSVGQMYQHVTQAITEYFLPNVRACASGGDGVGRGGKTLGGWLVFLMGSFPPARYRVPKFASDAPAQPSIAEARAGLMGALDAVRAIIVEAESAPTDCKTHFSRMGWLNAREWVQMIELHTRHHLRQKARLDAWLGASKD